MLPSFRLCLSALAMVAAVACSASATVIVRFDPPESTVSVGHQFQVKIMADIYNPVVGWGLDVSYNSQKITTATPPVIGPSWSQGYAPDGDGLAGLAFPTSINGNNILLATLTFDALDMGETTLLASVTPGDLTEGFPLDPTGFDTVTFEAGHVMVIPEPLSLFLLAVGACATGKRYKR